VGQHRVHILLIAVLLVGFFGLLGPACTKGSSNAGDIATQLNDRMSDALDFEGGEDHEGDPPAGSSSPMAPQLTAAFLPEDFRLNADFSIVLVTAYKEQNKISHAVIYITGATRYITVPIKIVDGVAELPGRLQSDEDIRAQDFSVQMALQLEDGTTGLYKPYSMKVKDEPAQEVGDPIETLALEHEDNYFESGRPEGTETPDAPQIERIEGPYRLSPGQEFDIKIVTDYPVGLDRIGSVILTTPGNQAYYEIISTFRIDQEKPSEQYSIISGTLSAEQVDIGHSLTFLWALKTNSGTVGVYRSWSIIISDPAAIPDGDQDTDVDQSEGPPEETQSLPGGPMSIARDGDKTIIQMISPFTSGIYLQ